MKLKFTKMHGAGNDFVVIDAINQTIQFTTEQWRLLGDRRFGVGADQILVVEKSDQEGIDFRYRIFNADGGEVEQCGNGSRAFVRFVIDKGLTEKTRIRVQTMTTVIEPFLDADGSITVDMGVPSADPASCGFEVEGLSQHVEGTAQVWTLRLDQSNLKSIEVCNISVGNPHAVQLVANVETHPVHIEGPQVESHPRFLKRVNAGFMQVLNPHQIALRVYERGAGETLACGTGACAAVVSGIRRGLLQSPVGVNMRGGDLRIAWAGEGESVYLSGPAVSVFEGEIEV